MSEIQKTQLDGVWYITDGETSAPVIAGGGGGSDTTTTSTQKAEFPPEFRPLATAAVNQILGLQEALPISGFAGFSPRTIAPFSSLQQQGLSLVPSLLKPTAGLQSLQQLGAPVAGAAGTAIGAGQPTVASQRALEALNSLLTQPLNLPTFPTTSSLLASQGAT